MTTEQVAFSEAVRRAERSITAPGFHTLTAGQQRIAILRHAVRAAGGEPVGPSFPSVRDEPTVIDALETQLRNLLDAANIAAPYNQSLIESSAPELDIADDPRLLATEGGAPPQDPVTPRQQTPATQPEPTAQTGQPYPYAIRAEEEPVTSQAASEPHPNAALRERALRLQQEIRDLGFTPVITGNIAHSDAATAVTRLTNQLNAITDPEREARIAPEEVSSTSTAAQMPVEEGVRTVSEPGYSPDLDPTRRLQVESLKQRIREAGGRPEFTEQVTPDNVFRAVQRLSAQLASLLALSRARRELEESAVGMDVLDRREREIMALQQAIRDYGEVPAITGEVRPDNYTTALLTLRRQLREVASRPPGFDEEGVNTDPYSTVTDETGPGDADLSSDIDDLTDEEDVSTRTEPEISFEGTIFQPHNPTGFMTFFEAYREVEPLFAPGALAPLFLRLLTDDGFGEWSVEEQTLHFLEQVSDSARLPSPGFSHLATPDEKLNVLLSRLTNWKPRDGVLTVKEEETIGDILPGVLTVASVLLDWAGDQWIPDSVADNLPDPLRIPLQAALNLTAPINFVMLFAGGAGLAKVGAEIAGEIIGGSLGQIAEDQGWPVPVQMTLEIVGGILGSNIGPELADAGSRSLARIAKELTGELLEAPGDSVKFARLIREGKVDEAYKAVRDNLIDDAGDIAGAAKFDEFRQRIIKAAIDNGLTEKEQLGMEVALGVFAETVELYNRPEYRPRNGDRSRNPVPFSLILDEEYVGFLQARIDSEAVVNVANAEMASTGLDKILKGEEPSPDQYDALRSLYGSDFTQAVSDATELGLLKLD